MWLTIGIVLFALWALGYLAFNIVSGVIHLALFLAVVAIIAHFVRKRAPRAV
jgi:fatty acid desaturase